MSRVEILVNGKSVPQGAVALNLNRNLREQIEYLLQSTAYRLIEQQVNLGNDPSEVLVDGQSNKLLTQAKRNIEVRFGSAFDKKIARIVERALLTSIRRHTQSFTGVLSDMSNWNWYLQDFEDNSVGRAKKINPYNLQTLTRNQRLLVIPDGVINQKGEAYASAADNWLNAKRGGGFLFYAKERLNKNRRFNNFYYCKVGGSAKNALPGEVGGTKTREPTTKCLVIRPRLKKRTTRARR